MSYEQWALLCSQSRRSEQWGLLLIIECFYLIVFKCNESLCLIQWKRAYSRHNFPNSSPLLFPCYCSFSVTASRKGRKHFGILTNANARAGLQLHCRVRAWGGIRCRGTPRAWGDFLVRAGKPDPDSIGAPIESGSGFLKKFWSALQLQSPRPAAYVNKKFCFF